MPCTPPEIGPVARNVGNMSDRTLARLIVTVIQRLDRVCSQSISSRRPFRIVRSVRPPLGTEQCSPYWFAMNVSWSDLNKVQEQGDYPFRDGTISVTFAEIAIWQKNPNTQFQLMRKYPLLGPFRYVLGRQIDEMAASLASKLIYESSNGDSWSLTRNPITGARAVLHRPNSRAGGQVSYIEVDKFLSEGANGPEHQALRLIIEESARPPSILIAYDIHPPKGETYENLIEAIRSLGVWWHHLETVWIVQCALAPDQIRDRLKSQIGIEDQLLIVDISGNAVGWLGVNSAGSRWLADNIGAAAQDAV